MHRMTRRTVLAAAFGAAALAVALPAAAQTKAAEPMKIGFVYVSPIGDAGWTSSTTPGARKWKRRWAPR